MCKIVLTENLVGVQPCTHEVILNEFINYTVICMLYASVILVGVAKLNWALLLPPLSGC